MGHLVQRNPKQKAFELEVWGIGEASLTPNPVEARTTAFPLKDMGDEEIDLDAFIKSLEPKEEEPDFDIAGIPALKAFCEDVAPSSLKDGSQRSQSAAYAVKEFITIGHVLGEAFHAYTSRLVRRTENRVLRDTKGVDASTVSQVTDLLGGIEKIEPVFQAMKEALTEIKKISDMSKAQQKAMAEKAKLAVWNYYRISGTEPKELSDASRS